MVARTAGRKGRPWRRAQAQVKHQPDVCSWCGHPGANEVDHIRELWQGGHPLDPRNHARIHGSSCPCPTCGQSCNQVKHHAIKRATRTNPTPPPEYSRW